MKKVLVIISVLLFGCATTYKPPIIQQTIKTYDVPNLSDELFAATNKVLIMEGYQILSSDKELGLISTSQKEARLTIEQANCGTTMGLAYIRDKRTNISVSYGIIISDNSIIIRANIEGNYLKGDAVHGLTLTCVSLGILEDDLANKIRTEMGN